MARIPQDRLDRLKQDSAMAELQARLDGGVVLLTTNFLYDPYGRLIAKATLESLLECFVRWVNEVRGNSGKRQIASMARHSGGAIRATHTAPCVCFSAMVVESGLVVYQRPSEGKKNEIRTVQQLLDILDISEACVTLWTPCTVRRRL